MPVISKPVAHEIVNVALHLLLHEFEPVYGTPGSHVMVELKVSPHDKVPPATHVLSDVLVYDTGNTKLLHAASN